MTEKKQFNLQELAVYTQCTLVGDPTHLICDVANLETATPQQASFFANPNYQQAMKNSQAGVVFIPVSYSIPLPKTKNYLLAKDPSFAFQQLIDLLYPQRSPSGFTGVHPTAVIHKTAKLAHNVTICPHAVIDEGAQIGQNSFIGAGCYIGIHTIVGEDCLIYPNVVIRENCVIGHRVILQPGVVIGSCGFGYITNAQGEHVKLSQVGNVYIEDDVEIGANTAVDRARFDSTRVGKGTKIDNLVQVGHNVSLGSQNLIVAQTGIAGSTKTGTHVVLAGHVAVAGHLELADRVIITAKSGVTKSLSSGTYGGVPAILLRDYNRNQVLLRSIGKYINDLKKVIARLDILEQHLKEI